MLLQLLEAFLITYIFSRFVFGFKTLKCNIFIFFITFIAVFFYQLITLLGLLANPEEFGYSLCQKLYTKDSITIGPEDLTKVDDNHLIFGSNDNIQLWELEGPSKTENGNMFVLIIKENNKHETRKLKMINFPSDIKFHPHGIYYRSEDQNVFVVNHSYTKESPGDRIDVFKLNLKEFEIVHLYGLQMEESLNGILNDVISIGKGKILTTQYVSSPDPIQGRMHKSILEQNLVFLESLLQLQRTFVIMCSYEEHNSNKLIKPNCTKLLNTGGSINNGIIWDKKKYVYVSDIAQWKINQYEISGDSLIKVNEIKSKVGVDNLNYDEKRNEIIGSGILKMVNFVSYVQSCVHQKKVITEVDEFWCGAIKINPQTLSQEVIFQAKNQQLGCSSVEQIGKKLYFGSFAGEGLVQCSLK